MHKREGTYRADRHGKKAAPAAPPGKPPRPPADVEGVEREAWLEVARQVAAAGTYTAAHYSAFRLAVRALAAVYGAPPDLKASTLRGLLETASKLLARFGLDPVATAQVDAPPSRDADLDRAQDFLFGARRAK